MIAKIRLKKEKYMKTYFKNLNKTLKDYFKVLSNEIPEFLYDYIDTPEMQRIGKIGCGCGTDYTKIFNNKFFYCYQVWIKNTKKFNHFFFNIFYGVFRTIYFCCFKFWVYTKHK